MSICECGGYILVDIEGEVCSECGIVSNQYIIDDSYQNRKFKVEEFIDNKNSLLREICERENFSQNIYFETLNFMESLKKYRVSENKILIISLFQTLNKNKIYCSLRRLRNWYDPPTSLKKLNKIICNIFMKHSLTYPEISIYMGINHFLPKLKVAPKNFHIIEKNINDIIILIRLKNLNITKINMLVCLGLYKFYISQNTKISFKELCTTCECKVRSFKKYVLVLFK